MKEELAEKTGLAMLEIIDTMVKAKNFAVEQAPVVVHELLSYDTVVYAAWSILWAMLLAVSIWGTYRFCLLVKDDDEWIPGVAFSVVCSAAFIVALYCSSFEGWVKIWLAPKVYLIEYAASLAK